MSETLTMVDGAERPPLYESLPVSFNETDITEAMRLYLEFLALPEEVKQRFHYFDEAEARISESGYMRRDNKNSNKPTGDDNKFLFHYTPDVWEVQHQLGAHEKPRIASQFIDVADQLYYEIAKAAKNKLSEWCQDCPWMISAMFPRNGKEFKHHLRFLGLIEAYARPHYDKSIATAAIAQSRNGLLIGEGQEDLEPVQRGNFDPIMFAGYGWMQIHEMLGTTTNRIPAFHGSDELPPETVEGERDLLKEISADLRAGQVGAEVLDITRVVVVDFLNPSNVYLQSTLEQTHTPIRWRNVGRIAMPIDSDYKFLAA